MRSGITNLCAWSTHFQNANQHSLSLGVVMTTFAHIAGDFKMHRDNAARSSECERSTKGASRGAKSAQARAAAEDLALAAHIHAQLMSIELPSVPYASMKARTIPCRAIGGDFFDAIALSDALFAVVADVSGKGAPAAIVAAMLQGIIHAEMLADRPLPSIAAAVNEFLCSRATGRFATMVLLKVYAGGRAEYVNCGHIPPVLVRDNNVRQLEGSNVVVGLLPEAQYRLEHYDLLADERILIFTDGVTEAENSVGDQFGDSALNDCDQLRSVEDVFEHVATFQGRLNQNDDWTLFELRYRGDERQAAFQRAESL